MPARAECAERSAENQLPASTGVAGVKTIVGKFSAEGTRLERWDAVVDIDYNEQIYDRKFHKWSDFG